MTNNPDENKIAEIRKNFDFFDEDKNGKIDLKEFTLLLNVIEPSATKEQAEKGFRLIDNDQNNIIDFDEFIQWWLTYWWQY